MTKASSEELSLSAQALKGAVESDQIRMSSNGKKSFLEASSSAFRVRRTLPMSGRKWDLLLPFSAFEKVMRLFKGDLEIENRDNKLIFKDSKREVALEVKDSEGWVPSPDWQEPKEVATFEGDIFRRLLRHSLRAVSSDAGRPLLQTVALVENKKSLSFVSTDSFRLIHLPLGGNQTASLPEPLLLEQRVAKALVADLQRQKPEEVFVEFAREEEARGGIISYGASSWFVRSPDGQYPEWEDLLDTSGASLKLDREDILELLRFVEALQGKSKAEQNGAAALKVELGEKVEAAFRRPGLGEIKEELSRSSWSGESETLGINPLFLRDMVEVLDGETLLGQKSSSGGIVFSGRDKAEYLLMPIRLSEVA